MELDTSYIVLTMAQAHDLSFFRIDRRDFQTIREVFLGDRPRMITPNTYTRFQSLEDRIFSDNPYIGANAVMHVGKVYQCGAECLADGLLARQTPRMLFVGAYRRIKGRRMPASSGMPVPGIVRSYRNALISSKEILSLRLYLYIRTQFLQSYVRKL